MGGGFRAAVARRYASSIRMDGDSGPQAEVMKGHGEAEAQESCGSLSGVRVVLVTTGSRGDAAVRVLPSQLSSCSNGKGGGQRCLRAGIARQFVPQAGGPIQMERAEGTEFRFENVVCCGSSSLNFTVVGGAYRYVRLCLGGDLIVNH